MSVFAFTAGAIRGLVIAAVTAGAALGALVVFDPFGQPPVPAANVTATASVALQRRIETLRLDLRETERMLDDARTVSAPDSASPQAGLRSQYEGQIAAATERRDLALRHADAIRQSLEAGVTPSSQAAIRDSVVIGQLLGQQAALDAQIAVESARLRPTHPTMRALNAQRSSLLVQIRQEAANIASALEAEAGIDAAQIELLNAQLPTLPADAPAPADVAALELRALSQRAELDGLVDAYFNIPPAVASPVAAPSRDLLSLPNLIVMGVAALAAIFFQLFLAARRRRAAIAAADLAAWQEDDDVETVPEMPAATQRKAAA